MSLQLNLFEAQQQEQCRQAELDDLKGRFDLLCYHNRSLENEMAVSKVSQCLNNNNVMVVHNISVNVVFLLRTEKNSRNTDFPSTGSTTTNLTVLFYHMDY